MNIKCSILIGFLFRSLLFIQNTFAFEATYYSDAFEGSRTANGNIFSQNIHSAALCDEELGNFVYVQGGGTGAVVTVNDRPNCSRHANVIDLSTSAFDLFAPLSKGRISDISVSVIGKNNENLPKKTLKTSVFSSLGVEFLTPVSNTYFAGDTILIEGRVLDKKEYVMMYLESAKDKKEYSSLIRVEKNGRFKFPFTLPNISGKYYFILASGNSFETTEPETINLVDGDTLVYPEIFSENVVFKPVLTMSATSYIALPNQSWATLSIEQGGKVYKTSGTALTFPTSGIKLGDANVVIDGYNLSTPSSLDRTRFYKNLWTGSVLIDRTRDLIGKDKVNIRTKKGVFTFQFRVGLGDHIRGNYYVTFPNGDVHEYEFQKKWIDEDGFLKQGSNITATFLARDPGVYKIEAVLENGYAYFNMPAYQGNVWSVIPTFSDKDRILSEKNHSQVPGYILGRINGLRNKLGRSELRLDDNLSRIAQLKAENMANNNYVGHWTPDGLDILGFAKSQSLPYPNTISENVAGGNVSYGVLQDGLGESGSHRHSMVKKEWNKIGIGYSIKNKKGYLVQVFSP